MNLKIDDILMVIIGILCLIILYKIYKGGLIEGTTNTEPDNRVKCIRDGSLDCYNCQIYNGVSGKGNIHKLCKKPEKYKCPPEPNEDDPVINVNQSNHDYDMEIPPCFFSLLKNYQGTWGYIWLPQVGLRGIIPTNIGDLTGLTKLNLSWNNLEGRIPISIGTLTGLTDLDLSLNKLDGPIPEEIGELKQLETLRLNRNQLTGKIPDKIGNLKNLTYLDLSSNKLSGPLPEIKNLNKLGWLSLGDNDLEGSIPTEIGTFIYLTTLDLSDNNFSGPLPDISQLVELTYLNLNNLDNLEINRRRKEEIVEELPKLNYVIH